MGGTNFQSITDIHSLANVTHKFEYNETVHQEGMEKVVVMKSTVIETLMA